MSVRTLSALLVLLAGCPDPPPPPAAAPAPPADRLTSVWAPRLQSHLERWALADPDDTWALAHALLALGPDARVSDGRALADAVLSTASLTEVGGRALPVFQGLAASGTPREPHRDLVVRSLLSSGVARDRTFQAGGRPFTVAELVDGARWTFEAPAVGRWGERAWSVLALTTPGEVERFVNHRGESFEGQALAAEALAELDRLTAFLDPLRAKDSVLLKHRQGIFGEPCGGFHLVQAAARARGPEALPVLTRIAERLSWRAKAETATLERLRTRGSPQPERLDIQGLKLHGHWLEAMSDLREAGVVISPEDVRLTREALERDLDRLWQAGHFERLGELRARDRQAALDMVGDAAHALGALRR